MPAGRLQRRAYASRLATILTHESAQFLSMKGLFFSHSPLPAQVTHLDGSVHAVSYTHLTLPTILLV